MDVNIYHLDSYLHIDVKGASMPTLELNKEVLDKLSELYASVFEHDGFGEIRVEMKILRRGQKEVIIHCGKQYRYVIDYKNDESNSSNNPLSNEENKPLNIKVV